MKFKFKVGDLVRSTNNEIDIHGNHYVWKITHIFPNTHMYQIRDLNNYWTHTSNGQDYELIPEIERDIIKYNL